MLARSVFYDVIRQRLIHVLTQQQVNGIETIFDYWEKPQLIWSGVTVDNTFWPLSWLAYILATAYHESAHTFRDDIREADWLSEEWRKLHLRYYPYYGRGLPQLTWEHNYRVWGLLLNLDLIGTPDLALGKISVEILIRGMIEGRFSGHRLSDYTNSLGGFDALHARHIVNVMDRAVEIEAYYIQFQQALTDAEKAPKSENADAIFKGNVELIPPSKGT